MIKRLVYPFKTNIFLFLISLFILLPFSFIFILENATTYKYYQQFECVSEKCIFEDYSIDISSSYDEFVSIIDKETSKVKKLSKKDFLYSEAVLSGTFSIRDKYNIKNRINVYTSSSMASLKGYANLEYGIKIKNDEKSQVAISKTMAIECGLKIGDKIIFENQNEEKIDLNLKVGTIFSSEYNNLIFIKYDNFKEFLSFKSDSYSLSIAYYYKSAVNTDFVNEAAAQLAKEVSSKSYQIDSKVKSFNLIFSEGKFVTFLVSIVILVVMFYAFYWKTKKLNNIENIQLYFYEKKTKSFIFHLLSDLFISFLSCSTCLIFVFITRGIMISKSIPLSPWISVYLLFIIQFIVIAIESSLSYLIVRHKANN